MIRSSSWTEEALCGKLYAELERANDPELTKKYKIDFHSNNPQEKARAKALCFSCPVRKECLQDALDTSERFGIRGGVDEQELRKVQAIDAEGKPFVHANRPIRCAYDGAWSTKYLRVREHKRTRTHVECTKCGLHWWVRKAVNKAQTNW